MIELKPASELHDQMDYRLPTPLSFDVLTHPPLPVPKPIPTPVVKKKQDTIESHVDRISMASE